MKLCFSTFSKVLLLCKLHNTTQENLIRAVFASIPNFYDASLDSSAVTNVVKGKKNLPDDALQKAKPEVAEEIYLEFKKKVFPLLDEGKFDVLVRGIKRIISESKLYEKGRIDYIHNTTKSNFLKMSTEEAIDALPGIFYYTVIAVENKGTEAEAKLITKEYIAKKSATKKHIAKKSDNKEYNETYKTSTDMTVSLDISLEARRFCIDYSDQKELLPLCQFALFVSPFEQSKRDLFTAYKRCSTQLQKEIMRINNIPIFDFSNSEWIDEYVDKFRVDEKKYKLATYSWLYGGAKYFHRALTRYKDISVSDINPYIFEPPSKNLIGLDYKLSIYELINNHIYVNLNQNKEDVIPPFDLISSYCKLQSMETSEEDVVFWICCYIKAACHKLPSISEEFEEESWREIYVPDGQIQTLEDLYYSALFALYQRYYPNKIA